MHGIVVVVLALPSTVEHGELVGMLRKAVGGTLRLTPAQGAHVDAVYTVGPMSPPRRDRLVGKQRETSGRGSFTRHRPRNHLENASWLAASRTPADISGHRAPVPDLLAIAD